MVTEQLKRFYLDFCDAVYGCRFSEFRIKDYLPVNVSILEKNAEILSLWVCSLAVIPKSA